MIAAWPTTVTKSRWPRAFALRTQKPFSALWKVTRSTRPASTSWVDGSRLDFIRIAGSSVLSLGATSVEPHRRRIIGRDNERMALDAERELTQWTAGEDIGRGA